MTKQELLQTAKPILFNTEMVQAILESRKTVTRRKIDKDIVYGFDIEVDGTPISYCNADGDFLEPEKVAPYKVGDILYARETYADHWLPDGFCKDRYVYKADGVPQIGYYGNDKQSKIDVWIPSIHMPKEAARIFLRITDVRVERLQEITWQQAAREGCQGSTSDIEDELFHIPTLKGEFHKLWDSTIKKQDLDTYGWNANPWVWVYEFEVISYDE